MASKKKGISLHSRFSLYSFATAIVPVFLSILITFVFILSLIHMIYPASSGRNPDIKNSRDIITVYFCQFNIREIEASLEKDETETLGFFGMRASKRLESYGFSVCVSIDGKTLYISDGCDEKYFSGKNETPDSYESGYVFLNDNTMQIRDVTQSQGGKSISVALKSTGKPSEEKTSVALKLWQLSDAGFLILFASFIAFATVFDVFLVRTLTKKIMRPIENLDSAAEKIKKGILNEPVIIDNSTQELGELSQTFEEMRIKLKNSLDSKAEYERIRLNTYSGLNHDIRTAVTTIKGYTQGLIDGIAATPEKHEKYINAIANSTASLEKLIDALSEVTDLETNIVAFKFKERDMYSLMTDWFTESASALEERHVKVRTVYGCDKRVFCNIDAFQIERVIDNILANCIKYKKPEKSTIEVDITTSIDTDGMYKIEYRDNGIGISSGDAERVFDVFYRADEARSNVQSGSGMGLSIVRQIILRHGGTIKAGGEKGKGLTLTLTLPITRTEEF